MTTEAMERGISPGMDPFYPRGCEDYYKSQRIDEDGGRHTECTICRMPCNGDCRDCSFAMAYVLSGGTARPERLGL